MTSVTARPASMISSRLNCFQRAFGVQRRHGGLDAAHDNVLGADPASAELFGLKNRLRAIALEDCCHERVHLGIIHGQRPHGSAGGWLGAEFSSTVFNSIMRSSRPAVPRLSYKVSSWLTHNSTLRSATRCRPVYVILP